MPKRSRKRIASKVRLVYVKASIVWARIAFVAGTVDTKEGVSR